MEEKLFIKNLDLLHNKLLNYAMELTGNGEDARELLLETVVRAFVEKDKMPADVEQDEWMKQMMHNIYHTRTENAEKRVLKEMISINKLSSK